MALRGRLNFDLWTNSRPCTLTPVMHRELLRLRFIITWRVRDHRLEEGATVGGDGAVVLICSTLRASLMHSQAEPHGSQFALRSKFAEQTLGAAEGSVSVAASLGRELRGRQAELMAQICEGSERGRALEPEPALHRSV